MNTIEEEINDFCVENNFPVNFLTGDECNALITSIAEKFEMDIDRLFMWEEVRTLDRLEYADPKEWEDGLNKYLQGFQKEIFVVITDENFYPWPVFKCYQQYLIRIFQNQRYFEYFLFDSSQQQLLFETHHNTFILC